LGQEGNSLVGVVASAKEDEAAELICRFTFCCSSAEILIAERWPEVELELWKFISFPVSERQFLLISGSTPPGGVLAVHGQVQVRPTSQCSGAIIKAFRSVA
jgi:hypothetical protein